MGMTYDNNIAELWLNPYNYLMMAQNTKNGLLEYVTNPYLISNDEGTGIENKYNELKYNLSRYETKQNLHHRNTSPVCFFIRKSPAAPY